jgi:hypothetical protein
MEAIKLLAIISDANSKRERRIPPIDIIINESNSILNPIVFDAGKIDLRERESYVLSNNSHQSHSISLILISLFLLQTLNKFINFL